MKMNVLCIRITNEPRNPESLLRRHPYGQLFARRCGTSDLAICRKPGGPTIGRRSWSSIDRPDEAAIHGYAGGKKVFRGMPVPAGNLRKGKDGDHRT